MILMRRARSSADSVILLFYLLRAAVFPKTAHSSENRSMDQNPATVPDTPLEGEDFYMDGPYLVFTAAYHLKRGSCCGSNCRHCPYGLAPAAAPPVPDEEDVP